MSKDKRSEQIVHEEPITEVIVDDLEEVGVVDHHRDHVEHLYFDIGGEG